MFFNRYPYTNFHELNLDEILRMMHELHHEWDEFTAVNKITNAGAWDITKQYQAWTVVSDNNIGYISLKPVPAGVAITNIEYWGVIADYNILITDLSNRISDLERDMDMIKNRKYIFIGDSWAEGLTYEGGTGHIVDSFVDYAINWLNIPADHYYRSTVSGDGFTTAQSFADLLNGVAIGMTDKDTVTDIIVTGGINDLPNTATLDSAISAFCTYAKTEFPNAKIHIGCVGRIIGSSMKSVIEIYKGCTKYGAAYMNNIENCVRLNILGSDGGHPLSAGYEFIAKSFVNYILTGYADDINEDITVTINVANGTLGAGSLNMTMSAAGDTVTIGFYSDYANITLDSIATLLTPRVLGTISGQSFVRNCGKRFNIPVWLDTGKMYPFEFWFSNGNLIMQPTALADVGTYTLLLTSFNVTLPLNDLT